MAPVSKTEVGQPTGGFKSLRFLRINNKNRQIGETIDFGE